MVERPWFILSLVERGWQAARELSLDVQARPLCFVHVIKGDHGHRARALVAERPNTRLVSLPYPLFWPGTLSLMVGFALTRRLRGILVDNERSVRRMGRIARFTRVPITLVRQAQEGYELRQGSGSLSSAAWSQQMESACALP